MRRFGVFAYHSLLIFGLLGVLFIPFSFRLLHVQAKITQFLFEDAILMLASLFELVYIANPAITSDSTTMYLLVIVLFLVAVIFAAIFPASHFWKKYASRFVQAIQLVLTFYLSLVLLKYGFDKIFKAQFYLPEPNTLFTPLGMLDKDILYWSTMGTSHIYNVFMGLLEVIPAAFLLFKRTRVLGLFALSAVLLHVVFINFGFDISVKVYALFLLFLCFLLLTSFIRTLFSFFVLNMQVSLSPVAGKYLIQSRSWRTLIKTALIIVFLAESLLPYIQSGEYNDDNIPRNHLHGAYEVRKVENGNENRVNVNIKRVFIHRHNYFIIQHADDTMEDFYLKINPVQNQFMLIDYEGENISVEYAYSEATGILELYFIDLGMTISSQSIPWKALPLLQPLFHWTVDGVQ